MMPVKRFLVRVRTSARAARLHHVAEIGLHVVYFGAVAVEGHGLYALAGGTLGVLTLVGVVLHGPEGE